MPIIEILGVKGLIAIGKAISAIAAKGGGAKLLMLGGKLISTYGLGTILSATFITGVIVGGILWTKERVDWLRKSFVALKDGENDKAIFNLARLVISSGIDVDVLPNVVEEYLLKIKIPADKAFEVKKAIVNMETAIAEKVSEMK